MAREKEGFREIMEQLNNLYPDHEMLTMEEVQKVLGYACPKVVKKHLGEKFVNHRLNKVFLARYMCGE